MKKRHKENRIKKIFIWLKKLNNNTYMEIHSQFMRFIFMVLITFILLCVMQNCIYQKTQQENKVLNTKIEIATQNINELNNQYVQFSEENQEQQNDIQALEAEVNDLQEKNYRLSHPQKAFNYTLEDLEMLAKLAYHEAGSNDCSDRQQQLVVAVVLCRVQSSKWPNTIEKVITQKGQYGSYNTKAWKNDSIPTRCYNNVLAVLNGEIKYPNNLVYQASFAQRPWGEKEYKIYEKYYTPSTGTTTYFCEE